MDCSSHHRLSSRASWVEHAQGNMLDQRRKCLKRTSFFSGKNTKKCRLKMKKKKRPPCLAEHELEECFAELQQVLQEKDAASEKVAHLNEVKPGDPEYDDVLQELETIRTCIQKAIATIPIGAADYIIRAVHQTLTLMKRYNRETT